MIFVFFFEKFHYNNFRKNNILIRNLIIIWRGRDNNTLKIEILICRSWKMNFLKKCRGTICRDISLEICEKLNDYRFLRNDFDRGWKRALFQMALLFLTFEPFLTGKTRKNRKFRLEKFFRNRKKIVLTALDMKNVKTL